MFKKLFVCMFLMIYSFAFGEGYQVIVSQFNVGLKDSRDNKLSEDDKRNYKYSLTEGIKNGDIKSINSTSLDNTINHIRTMGNTFTGSEGDLQYDFNTAEKSIIIPVSSSSPTSGAFELSEVVGNVKNYYIQEKYVFPEKLGELSKVSSDTGVKFNYTEKPNNYTKYKRQEYMIRIAKGSNTVDYTIESDSNGKKLANAGTNAADFLGGVNGSYVDFWVTGDQYDKEQTITTDKGLSLKFFPGNIEVFGLPEGSYVIEMYSFRYSKETTSTGNVVVTKESNKPFTVGAKPTGEYIDIINFSSGNFPEIKATILTVSSTTSNSISLVEDELSSPGAIIVNTFTATNVETATTGAIYIDSSTETAIGIEVKKVGELYYQLWDVTYITTNTNINTNERRVIYKNNQNNLEATTTYNVRGTVTEETFTNDPLHQTIFVGFTESGTYTNGEFEIEDRYMNKYSDGYRSLRTANVPLTVGAIDIERIYKGNGITTVATTNSSFNWIPAQSGHNTLIISKPISDSKGTYRKIGDTSKTFDFYTTEWTPNLRFNEVSDVNNDDDTIKVRWDSPNKNSYDVSLAEDKVMFRIIKSSANSENLRYKPDINSNPIMESTSANLSAFLSDTTNTKYFDVLFKSGEDSKLPAINNVEFTFFKNNILQIVGLAAGTYQIQVYSIQNKHTSATSSSSYDYRVLTYGSTLGDVRFGLPELEKDIYDDYENPYIIDSINVTTNSEGEKEVEVGVVIKADQVIKELTEDNLIARKDEVATTSAFYYTSPSALLVEAWKPNYSSTEGAVYTDVKAVSPSTISVFKSAKADFKYPLDIVFLIDNSGSMQYEIDAVTAGLTAFSEDLSDRGYNANYKVIQFGGSNKSSGWFTNAAAAKTYFEGIDDGGGYGKKQENGAEAISNGITSLRAYGRYLNRSFDIKSASDSVDQKYMPSKKWLILLTDENMDKDQSSNLGYSKTRGDANYVVKKLSERLRSTYGTFSDNITLTGIFHLNTLMTALDNNDNNNDTLPSGDTTHLESLKLAIVAEGATVSESNNGYIKNSDVNNPKGEIRGDKPDGYIGKYKALQITDKRGRTGTFPSDSKDIFYTEFAIHAGNLFSMYEMGDTGEHVSGAIADSVKDIGIIQRWIIKYTSPYGKEIEENDVKKGGNDGELREVIFSFHNVKHYKNESETINLTSAISTVGIESGLSPRNYVAPITMLEASFINPSKENRTLEKKLEGIKIETRAQSQYKKRIETDEGVTYQLNNYPITKGTFIISGIKSDGAHDSSTEKVSITVSSDRANEYGQVILDPLGKGTGDTSKWYYPEVTIPTDKFNEVFGKKPRDVVITFIVETAEESETIYLSDINVVDKTAPVIRDFKMTNITLKEFMGDLGIFNTAMIEEKATSTLEAIDGAIKKDSFTEDKELNVKDGDTVLIEFTLDDESITKDSSGVGINYKQTPYRATGENISDSSNPYRTKWTVEIPISLRAEGPDLNLVKNIELNIVDDNNNKLYKTDNGNEPYYVNVFHSPNLLANTTLIAPTSLDRYTGDTNTEYYKDKVINANKVTGALAYLMVFNYDSSVADVGAVTNPATNGYSSSGTKKWISSVDGDFSFYEGRHSYDGKVYVMNASGAIMDLTHYGWAGKPSQNLRLADGVSIEHIVESSTTSPSIFYIDRVDPTVTEFDFRKYSDMNLNRSDLLNNHSDAESLLIGSISSDRPYKESDLISFNFSLQEKHFFKTVLDEGLIETPLKSIDEADITADSYGLEGTQSSFEGAAYKIRGTAIDLTLGSAGSIDRTGTIKVYDKAGNITPLTFTANYDDSIPENVSINSIKSGNGIKFTNNTNLPLNNIDTDNNFSVALLESELTGKKYVGRINGGGIINLTEFTEANGITKFSPHNNGNNPIKLTTFSKSGVVGTTVDNSIVLDTSINDNKTSYVEKVYSYDTIKKNYTVNLTNMISSIKELVGLSKYKISTNSNAKISNDGTTAQVIGTSGVEVDLSSDSGYYSNPTITNYTTINNIVLPSGGRTDFEILFTDRFGYTRKVDYIIEIPNNIIIKGKTSGDTKEIVTKIDNSSKKVKINSRKE